MKFEKSQEYLLLPKGIALTRTERIEMCRILESGLKEIYSVSKFYRGTLLVENTEVDSETIHKAINNRYLLGRIIDDPKKKIDSNIQSKEQLFDFVKSNLNDLFRPSGKYFNAVYSILDYTTKKGKQNESFAFECLEKIAKGRGLQIQVLSPRTVSDDVYGGIDGFFLWNDREFTIQIKPLFDREESLVTHPDDENYLIAYCGGFIKDLQTDYLILTQTARKVCHVFKAKGIIAQNDYYLIPKQNKVD